MIPPLSEQIALLEKHIEIVADVENTHGRYWLHPKVHHLACKQALQSMQNPHTVIESTAYELNEYLRGRFYYCDGSKLHYIDTVTAFGGGYFISAVWFDGVYFRGNGGESGVFETLDDAINSINKS